MPTNDLKIRKVRAFNPQLKKSGFSTRAIINGTETFSSVAEEASRNTTLNKYELSAALGIAAEQFARALKNGYAVDLGPLGKIYPTVTSKWTETAEEQTKSLLKKGLRFDASSELKVAVEAMRLTWERPADEEVVEEEVVEEEEETEPTTPPAQGGEGNNGNNSTENSGGQTESGPLYTIAWYAPNYDVIEWRELAAGAPIVDPPSPPEGYRWAENYTEMPAMDIDVMPVKL